jgi:toxin-antitoxin system PIN domain toxin
MQFPDVNVLIYAFRNDSPENAVCRAWLDTTYGERRPLAVCRHTLASVIRVTTNRRSFRQASTLDEAIGFCEDLLAYPHCELIEPGRDHWRIFTTLLKETGITGPMVTDAWLAALAIEWNCEFVTMDRDFARFPKLRCSNPVN